LPELPEVENVRRKLEELIVGQEILSVEVFAERIIRTPDAATFAAEMTNQAFHSIDRRGKHLIFVLEEAYIVSHLRMEGKFHYVESSKPLNKHDHVVFHLKNGYDLRYNDVRKFGTMDLVKDPKEVKSVFELGVEPNDPKLDVRYLTDKLIKKKCNVKKALLEQTIIAGLGNIYVDEVLFYSKIHPENDCSTLSKKQLSLLIKGTNAIIKDAIENGGSSIRSYNSLGEKGSMQNFHKVYGRNGEECVHCGTIIKKTKVGGRGTHFCPACQKIK